MVVLALTLAVLAGLRCPDGQRKLTVRDQRCPGLWLELRSSGGTTWYADVATGRGARSSLRLGSGTQLSLADARRACTRLRAEHCLGHTILSSHSRASTAPSLMQVVLEHFLPFISQNKRSWREDCAIIRRLIAPMFGHVPINAISALDLIRWRQGLVNQGLSSGSINRYHATFRHLLTLSIQHYPELEFPSHTLKPLPYEPSRRHQLSTTELTALLAAVQRSRNRLLPSIIHMLLSTGARKREVLDACWADIDLNQAAWTIPCTKSGRPRRIPLSVSCVAMLHARRRRAVHSPYVFASPRTGQPLVSIHMAWDTARRQAGLPALRLHDLRHSVASALVNQGCSLYQVQCLLGHRSSRMTQHYARLTDEGLAATANAINHWLSATAAAHTDSTEHPPQT